MQRTQSSSKFNLFKRASVVAVLAMTSLITTATAQDAPQAPRVPQAPAKPPISLHPGNGSSPGLSDAGTHAGYGQGWTYVHATSCDMYDAYGSTYVVLYPQEGGWFWTTSPQYQNALLTACQTGNWIGFYIYDYNSDWNELYTYNYK